MDTYKDVMHEKSILSSICVAIQMINSFLESKRYVLKLKNKFSDIKE